MAKRIFGIILAVLMVTSLLSVASFAAEKPTVTDLDGNPVDPDDDTYTYEDNGIHVHASGLTFSGTCDEAIHVDTRDITLRDVTVNGSIFTDSTSIVVINLDNAEINGDAIGTGEGLYFCFCINGDNAITGDIISDGSACIYGESDSKLAVKSVSTQEVLILESVNAENMSEEYISYETSAALPADGSKPIIFTTKKQTYFSDPIEGDYIINGGKPFKCGEDIDIGFPTVYDEDVVELDPQPELIIEYDKITVIGSEEFYDTLEEKPNTAGRYCAIFFIPSTNSTYTGSSPMYEFTIEHDLKRHDGKAATKDEAGYKAYYSCECGEYFEDAKGTIEIEDLTAWLSEGGRGYIEKLKADTDKDTKTKKKTTEHREDHIYLADDADQNATNPDTGAPIMTNELVAAGILCAVAVTCFGRKKKN